MNLTTKCPQCQTLFAASLEQLQLRKGYVRCVKCSHIFDGYEAVVSGDPIEPQASAENQAEDQTEIKKSDSQFAHTISDLQEADYLNEISADPFTISDFDPATDSKPATHKIQPTELFAPVYSKPLVTEPIPEANHELYVDRRGSIVMAFWVVLVAVGVAALLLQLAFVFRVQIAEAMPAARPRLERMCNVVGCSVAWSRKPEFITVVYSSLQSSPEQQAENNETHVILQVRLRNSYIKPQEWPTLVLDLTDAAGARIARKNIAASEYLTPVMAKQPFPASTEHNINLPLTLHGLTVNGYQLSTFFP